MPPSGGSSGGGRPGAFQPRRGAGEAYNPASMPPPSARAGMSRPLSGAAGVGGGYQPPKGGPGAAMPPPSSGAGGGGRAGDAPPGGGQGGKFVPVHLRNRG